VIVADASAIVEFLLQTPLGARVEARLFQDDDEVHVPHLLDIEVAQALRRLVRSRELSRDRAEEALADLVDLDLQRHPHVDFLHLTSIDATRPAFSAATGT
jgi:predicted nucleic acid-binding protein